MNVGATNETVILTPEVLDIAIRGAFSNIWVPKHDLFWQVSFLIPIHPQSVLGLGPISQDGTA